MVHRHKEPQAIVAGVAKGQRAGDLFAEYQIEEVGTAHGRYVTAPPAVKLKWAYIPVALEVAPFWRHGMAGERPSLKSLVSSVLVERGFISGFIRFSVGLMVKLG